MTHINIMLRASNSRSSLYSQQKVALKASRHDALQVCQSAQDILQESARVLSHIEFTPILQKTLKSMLAKAQVEGPNSQSIFLQTVKQCLTLYGGSLQLNIRTLLLEILSELNCNVLEEISTKIDKAKHIVLQTQVEYLLSKIFLLETKYYTLVHDTSRAIKCLKKCLQLNEQHLIEFMQQSEQIRKEIVDYAIVAYYQYFKLIKDEQPVYALEVLLKASSAASKNYGKESKVTRGLYDLYHSQEHIVNSMDKVSTKSRAITDIIEYKNKKNYSTVAFYSWEDEKIVVQLVKTHGKGKQIVSETSYDIQLDINKIRLLKSTEWIVVEKGEIYINQDELLRILGFNNNESNPKNMTTGIELRNLSKDDIVKKNSVSSSEDDEDIFSQPGLNMLKFPRAQSSRKFKQTQ